MLPLKMLNFPDNLLLIEEEPIFIDNKLSKNIIKNDAQIELDKTKRRYRTGKVLAMGKICEDANTVSFSSSTTGKNLTVSVGTIVLYDCSIADVNDCPIEYDNQPETARPLVYLNRNFVQAIIQE